MIEFFSSQNQITLPFQEEESNLKIFRPIHYLGSKFRILDFIQKTIDEVDPDRGEVFDLFAGSGSVSQLLSKTRQVTSVDIQEYSRVICSAILNPISQISLGKSFIDECKTSLHFRKLNKAIEPLINYEKDCILSAFQNELEPLCNLLEYGSIIAYEENENSNIFPKLNSLMKEVKQNLRSLNFIDNSDALAVRYFGGLYFSYFQAVQIDTILYHIQDLEPQFKDCFQAALLSSVSDSVNTVGKQFAQPIRPRQTNGNPKPNLGKALNKDRGIDIFELFHIWIHKYMSIQPTGNNHRIFKMDYLDSLDKVKKNTSVVYADPPYTRDHYSRFYHTLETLCLRDNPKLSKTIVKGESQISRGLYRESRHQSPFCIKSQAPAAFDNLFSKVKEKKLSLVLSYSPFDQTQNSHPRLLTIDQLTSLAKKYFKNVEIVSPGKFIHSKLNSSEKHLGALTNAEILMICK